MARTTTGSAEASLTAALQPVVRSLVADMRARLEADPARLQSWRTEHAEAQKADRVGSSSPSGRRNSSNRPPPAGC